MLELIKLAALLCCERSRGQKHAHKSRQVLGQQIKALAFDGRLELTPKSATMADIGAHQSLISFWSL